jgi:hypothetical protein
MTEIVIDPEIPAAARRELEQTPLSGLTGFNDPSPEPRARRPGGTSPRGQGLAAGGVLAVAAGLLCVGMAAKGPFSADLVFLGLLIMLPLALVGCLSLARQVRGGPGPAALYRRRYVVPVLDLHGDDLDRWRRAARAARSIEASEAVRLGLVEAAEIAAALPYRLWEIAERLALLSGPERRQASILRGLDVTDPDIQAVLEPQRQVQRRTVADVERRIRRLEELAALAARTDAARRRRQAVEQLSGLNPDYEELLVRLDDPDSATGPELNG